MASSPRRPPSSETTRSAQRRPWRPLLLVPLWGLFATVSLVASAWFHLDTPPARRLAATLLSRFVSGEIQGSLHIGRIEHLSLTSALVRHVTLRDAQGRKVAVARTVRVEPDPWAALEGTLRFRRGELRDVSIRLIESDQGALPTLITLFRPSDPTPSEGPPLHAVVDRIRLRDARVRGELLGLRGIVAEQVAIDARLEAQRELHITIERGTGRLTRPFPFEGHLRLSADIDTDPFVGFVLHAEGKRPDRPEEEARADLTLRLPAGAASEDSMPLRLRIRSRRISADSLRGLGYTWADPLTGSFRGEVVLYGVPSELLHIDGDLQSDGGPVTLRGRIPTDGAVRIRFRTPGIDVHRVLGGAPELHAGGTVQLRIDEGPEAVPHATLDLLPFTWGPWQLPALHIEGRLLADGFPVDRLRARHAGGRLQGRGKLWWDGRVRLDLHAHRLRLLAEPNARERTGGAAGLATGHLRVRRDPGPPARLRIEGPIEVESFQRGPITARRLRLDGWMEVVETGADRSLLRLRYTGSSEGTRAWGVSVGSGSLLVEGHDGRYAVHADLAGGHVRALSLRMDLEEVPQGYRYVVPSLRLTVGPHRFEGAIEAGLLGQHVSAVEGLRLRSGPQRLQLTLRSGPRDTVQMDLRADRLEIAPVLASLAPGSVRVGGRLDGRVTMRGTWAAPLLDMEGSWRGGRVEGIEDIDLDWVAHHEPDGRLTVEAQAELAQEGHVAISGLLWLPPGSDSLRDAFAAAVYDVEIGLLHVPLPTVLAVAGRNPVPGISGALGGSVQLEGPLDAPTTRGTLRVPNLSWPGMPPLSARAEFSYEHGAVNALLGIGDEHGELLQGELTLLLDIAHLLERPAETVASLESAPWRLAAALAPRPLARWPLPALGHLPNPWNTMWLGAHLVLQGGALTPRGELLAVGQWGPEGVDTDCGPTVHPRVQIEAAFRGERTEAQILLMDGQRRVARVLARAETPVQRWLAAARIPAPPRLDFDANLAGLSLGRYPRLCAALRGELSGVVHGRDLFGPSPRVTAELRSDGLVLRRFGERGPRGRRPLETETVEAVTRAWVQLDHRDLRANVVLNWPNGGRSLLSAIVPVQWPRRAPYPVLVDDDEVAVDVVLEDTPLGPLLVRLPGFVDSEGRVRGQVRVEGVFGDPRAHGELSLRHGRLGIAPMGQQLRDVEARLKLTGTEAELVDFVSYDAEGELRARGSMRLDRLLPRDLRIAIRSDRFPVRDEGSILAHMTGRALLEGEYHEGTLRGTLRVHELNVRLPEELNRSLQPIEPHPDVELVRGGAHFDDIQEEPFHMRLRIRSERPFWVRRTDLAVLVETDVVADWKDPELRLEGFLEVRRGYFEVFGKRFEVQRARTDFLGDVGVNPEVALVATHQLTGNTTGTVTVTVTGRLAAPEVEFTTSVPGCRDRSQAIMLLLSGQCGLERQAGAEEQERLAGEQATRFLSGILAGVLTLTARAEFGEVVPVIAVETGERVGSARVRAGWQADSLVPRFLRDIVRGAYVEGYLTTAGTDAQRAADTGGASTDLGALLELQFPHKIVGRGVVSSSGRWSVDLTYEP